MEIIESSPSRKVGSYLEFQKGGICHVDFY